MGAFPPRKGSLVSGAPPSMNGVQSNTIVPNKSTMVEDDDDMAGTEDDYDARSDAFALDAVLSRRGTTTTLGEGERKLLADSQSQVTTLQEKVAKLEEMLRSKDEELTRYHEDRDKMDRLEEMIRTKDEEIGKYQDAQDHSQVSTSERQEWDDLKLELESKISKAEDLNSSLQMELDKVRMEQEAMEADLRGQIDEASRQGPTDTELQARFADLEVKHRGLQEELREQQQVTEEVRREAAGFLMEMRALSEQSHARWEQEEQLSGEVHRLEEEIQQWKSRYAKAKTQLRHLRASSTGIAEIRPDVSTIAHNNELLHEHGLIKDVHVTKFQISIDELLRIARLDDHRQVMQQVKAVIVAVRYIVHDVGLADGLDDGLSALRTKATRRVSATANNMITASKNFANSSGLSPVSLLDAAASHLSTAVIELIRLVKICPTPVDNLDEEYEEHLAQMKSPDYFSVAPSQSRLSHNESVYSAISPPHSRNPSASFVGSENGPNGVAVNGKSYAAQSEDHELKDMKFYLEDQTDGLVQSIQALVSSIRGDEGLAAVHAHVSAITSIVTHVSSSAEHFIHRPETNQALRERAGPLIRTLDEQKTRLMSTVADGDMASDADDLRRVTNKLPPIAFEIARETKELVQRFDAVDYDDSEDDFR
ncbi:hypothetical protein BDV59DRAFT_183813 [Aspergillus ambiguus]|uniref:putative cell polarity protein n=1 Tax=Aspergillus ambiguus TaxID=176160 RepID=UPI003CCD212B